MRLFGKRIRNRNAEYHTGVFCPVCGTEQDATWMKTNGTEDGDYYEAYHCACGCRFVADYMGPDENCDHVINSEYEMSRNARPIEYGPPVNAGSDIQLLRTRHPDLMTVELCPECDSEVEIHAYGRSKCPNCGSTIKPCSMCSSEQYGHCNSCPYSKNGRHA
ncbi:MAG: hypothetical protein WCR24_07480 [Candidatus Methanomethylophilaceae archaeon]